LAVAPARGKGEFDESTDGLLPWQYDLTAERSDG
jgi:hypothetical protein